MTFLRTQQFDPIKTSKMAFEKEFIVDKFIKDNLQNLTKSNMADLMSKSVKVSKDLKRVTFLKKHLPLLAGQLDKLNSWGFRDASAVIYGLQYMTETDPGVLQIIQIMAKGINHINNNLNEKIQECDIAKLLSGLKRFSSNSKEVLELLSIITYTLQNCCFQRFTNKNISAAINGLTFMSSDSIEVRTLLSVLSKKLSDCNGILESNDFTNIFFGLRGMNSESPEVLAIILVVAMKLKESNVEFKASQLLNMLSCLSQMNSDNAEVRTLLSAISIKISNCREGYQPNSMGNAINGLQGMSTDRREVRTILHLLATKIRQNHDEWNSLGLSSAYSGMQRMTNCSESHELLFAIVAKVRNLKKEMSIDSLGVSMYGLQDLDSEAVEVRDTVHALNIELKKNVEMITLKSMCNILFGLQNMKRKHVEVNNIFHTLVKKIENTKEDETINKNANENADPHMSYGNRDNNDELNYRIERNNCTINDITRGLYGLASMKNIDNINDYHDIEILSNVLYVNICKMLNFDSDFQIFSTDKHCNENKNGKEKENEKENEKEKEKEKIYFDIKIIPTTDLILLQQSILFFQYEIKEFLTIQTVSKWEKIMNILTSEIEFRNDENKYETFISNEKSFGEERTKLLEIVKESLKGKCVEITQNDFLLNVFESDIILIMKINNKLSLESNDHDKSENTIEENNLYNIMNIEIDSISNKIEKKKLYKSRRDNILKENGITVLRIHSVTLETKSTEDIISWFTNKFSGIEKS